MVIVEQVKGRADDVRERLPVLDHVVRMQEHYTTVFGTTLAGGITYFGFLSVFPVLLLAFSVIGWVSGTFPDARDHLVDAIGQVLPMTGGSFDMDAVESAAPGIGAIGVVTVLYAGTGWLKATRTALMAVFEVEKEEKPNFFLAQALNVVTLLVIGVILLLSVSVSGVATRMSEAILKGLGLGEGVHYGLVSVALLIGVATSTLLFWCIFKLLGEPGLPARALWSGALLGGIGFELLKQLSTLVLASTTRQPAFQAFGIALVLLVWINFFARVVVYAACWSWTAPSARALRAAGEGAEPVRVQGSPVDLRAAAVEQRPGEYVPGRRARDEDLRPEAAFTLGAGVMLAVVALLRRTVRR